MSAETLPGRTATKPVASAAMPASPFVAPWLTGTGASVQVTPPSVLSQTAGVRVTTVWPPAPRPCAVVVAMCPERRMPPPPAAAPVMSATVPLPAGIPSCGAAIRCQCRPSADVQITAVPSAEFCPAAR